MEFLFIIILYILFFFWPLSIPGLLIFLCIRFSKRKVKKNTQLYKKEKEKVKFYNAIIISLCSVVCLIIFWFGLCNLLMCGIQEGMPIMWPVNWNAERWGHLFFQSIFILLVGLLFSIPIIIYFYLPFRKHIKNKNKSQWVMNQITQYIHQLQILCDSADSYIEKTMQVLNITNLLDSMSESEKIQQQYLSISNVKFKDTYNQEFSLILDIDYIISHNNHLSNKSRKITLRNKIREPLENAEAMLKALQDNERVDLWEKNKGNLDSIIKELIK